MASTVKTIDPGRFNKRLEVYRYTDVVTELGSDRTVLTKIGCVWAELRPTRGTEFLEYYRDANSLQFKATMRYHRGIALTEKDVLVYAGRQFEINSIINIVEKNKYLEVYCTESKDKKVLYA